VPMDVAAICSGCRWCMSMFWVAMVTSVFSMHANCRMPAWRAPAVLYCECSLPLGAVSRVTTNSPSFRFCKGSLLRTGYGRKLAQPFTLLSRMPQCLPTCSSRGTAPNCERRTRSPACLLTPTVTWSGATLTIPAWFVS
jgi:hypothetical protein